MTIAQPPTDSTLQADGAARVPVGAPALEMRRVIKRFPGTVALAGVDLTVGRGEIHGLLGQNGAGKSTLMKILAGDYTATSGEVLIDGEPVQIANPRDARRLGIGIVHQELSLLPNLSVADNLVLGDEPLRGRTIDQRKIRNRARGALDAIGLRHVHVDTLAGDLPIAEQQLVEIARVLAQDVRVLIFDEPTAALNHDDAERLFAAMRSLRGRGVSIIFITHRYREVMAVCDRCTVLRNGQVAGTVDAHQATIDGLIAMTVGRQLDVTRERAISEQVARQHVVLSVRGLTLAGRVEQADFDVHRGEIVGLVGLLGSGQSELARALVGDLTPTAGVIELDGAAVVIRTPRQAARLGIGFISDSRKEEGIFPDMSVRGNIAAAALPRFRRWRGWPGLSAAAERDQTRAVGLKTGLSPAVLGRPIRLLSGGNQQKAIVARWLLRDARVLVCLEPTRGVDIGARMEIYRQLDQIARDGKSVVVVSTDVEEVLHVADTVVTLYKGQVTARLPRYQATEEDIMRLTQEPGSDAAAVAASTSGAPR
jgi:ribose transport system ATP-binding protein